MEQPAASVDTLLSVLGTDVAREVAEQLLQQADGSIETAVAMYFSAERPVASTARQNQLQNKEQALRAILGDELSLSQLRSLLREARGSVEAAVDLFFSRPPQSTAARDPSPDTLIEGVLQWLMPFLF